MKNKKGKRILMAFALLSLFVLSGCQENKKEFVVNLDLEEKGISDETTNEYLNECIIKLEEGDDGCLTMLEDYLNDRIKEKFEGMNEECLSLIRDLSRDWTPNNVLLLSPLSNSMGCSIEETSPFGLHCVKFMEGDMTVIREKIGIICLKEFEPCETPDKMVKCQLMKPNVTLTMQKDYMACFFENETIECEKGNLNYIWNATTTTEKHNCITQNYIDYAYGGNKEEYYKDFQEYLDTYRDEAFEVGYENSDITICEYITTYHPECYNKEKN